MAYTKNPVNPKAPSNNALWTKKDDSLLKEMASNKSTTAQIAIALGRTKASVWGRKCMLGIKGRLASSRGQNVFAPTTLGKKPVKDLNLQFSPIKLLRMLESHGRLSNQTFMLILLAYRN